MLRWNHKFRTVNSLQHRTYDENGFLLVDESPILTSGILEYYGYELAEYVVYGENDEPFNYPFENNRIYKVYMSPDELRKAAETFKMHPLTIDHKWMGKEESDAKGIQIGSLGEKYQIQEDKLYFPMCFTGKEAIQHLEKGDVSELSAAYSSKLHLAPADADYDFYVTDIVANHVALVEEGRCGPEVRVLNGKPAKLTIINNESKSMNNDVEVDEDKFFKEESQERDEDGNLVHQDSVKVENVDKNEIEREIEALSAKPSSDFKGGLAEKLATIRKLTTEEGYDSSERSKTDNEERVDKDAGENEVEAILFKYNVPKDVIYKIRGIMTKDDYNASERSKTDNSDSQDDKLDNRSCNSKAKLLNSLRQALHQEEQQRRKCYNAVAKVIGEFNPFGMSAKEMLCKALNHKGISLEGTETEAELQAMLKVCNEVSQVDDGFGYIQDSGTQEKEFNF